MSSIPYDRRAQTTLKYLARVFGQGASQDTVIDDAVSQLFDGWGHRSERENGNNEPSGAPYEYSLVLGPEDVELRVFFRPQAPSGRSTPMDSWSQGWHTLQQLSATGTAHLDRAETLTDLFRPEHPQASLGMCIGASLGTNGISGTKVYFDGVAQGRDRITGVTKDALARLGYGSAFEWLRSNDPRDVANLMFSLDLLESPSARVKLYSSITETTSSELEARLVGLPGYEHGAASAFLAALTQGRPGKLPDSGVRPHLCWSLTDESILHPSDVTFYYPFRQEVPGIKEAREALEGSMPPRIHDQVTQLLRDMESYSDSVLLNPFHWAATKLKTGSHTVTAYFSAASIDPVAEQLGEKL